MDNINIIEIDDNFPYEFININSLKKGETINAINGLKSKEIVSLLERGVAYNLSEEEKESAITILDSIEYETIRDCIIALSNDSALASFSQRAKSVFLPVSVSYVC